MKSSNLIAAVALTGVLFLASCGGGGGGTTPPPPPAPTLKIASSVAPDGVQGQPYSLQMSATGGTGAVTWSIITTDAAWANIDSGTGMINGTPTSSGQFFATVRARDAGSHSVDATVFIWISGVMAVSGTPDPANRGTQYEWMTQLSGGKQPFTASIVSGALPPGINTSLNAAWLKFAGTASEAGTYAFTVRIKDSASTPQTLDQQFTITVNSILKITSESLKPGVVGRAYSDSVRYVNGTPPLHWESTNQGGGLTINPDTGTVTGTPQQTNIAMYVRVTDSAASQQSDERFVWVNSFDVLKLSTPVTAITGHIGTNLHAYLYPDGGMPPVTASVASGSLPVGLAFDGYSLDGVPTQAGTWNFGLHYADAATPPQTYDQPVVVTILPPLPVILNSPETPLVGEPYSFQMLAAKGTPPYKWSVKSGTIPGGLSLSQNGLLGGTALAGGRYYFTLEVADSASPAQSAQKYIDISLLAKPLGRNDSIATATNALYSFPGSLSPFEDPVGTASPDNDYYKYYATAGSQVSVFVVRNSSSLTDPVLELLDSNGLRFNTCQDPGDDSPTAPIVADSTPTAFDDGCLNDDIDLGVDLNSRLTFKVPGPAGGVVPFYAHVLDNQGNARPDMGYFFQVTGALDAIRVYSDSNLTFLKGRAASIQLGSSGGTGTKTWSLASGTLPPGLSLSSSGILSGTPTSTGNWVFTASLTDSSTPPMTATGVFGVRVVDPVKITMTSFPNGQTGVPYSAQLTWTGGMAPFQLVALGLDEGITFNTSTGAFSGNPKAAGTYNILLSVSDNNGPQDTKTLSLTIAQGPLYVATTSLPNATKSAIYSAFVIGSGGRQPYTWQVMSGALPPGMSLNVSTGEIRGIPTSTGVYSFTVKVTDANAATSTATLQLTVQ